LPRLPRVGMKRTLEKLEIERRYWESKNIQWKIITDKEINKTVVSNIEMFREIYANGMDTSWITEQDINFIGNSLNNKELTLSQAFKNFRKDKNNALLIFKHLVTTHRIKVNLKTQINMNTKIKYIVGDINETK